LLNLTWPHIFNEDVSGSDQAHRRLTAKVLAKVKPDRSLSRTDFFKTWRIV
jgi:hypothetical protein